MMTPCPARTRPDGGGEPSRGSTALNCLFSWEMVKMVTFYRTGVTISSLSLTISLLSSDYLPRKVTILPVSAHADRGAFVEL